jgi:hypothetical protein
MPQKTVSKWIISLIELTKHIRSASVSIYASIHICGPNIERTENIRIQEIRHYQWVYDNNIGELLKKFVRTEVL